MVTRDRRNWSRKSLRGRENNEERKKADKRGDRMTRKAPDQYESFVRQEVAAAKVLRGPAPALV
jgi:hypothetical protein